MKFKIIEYSLAGQRIGLQKSVNLFALQNGNTHKPDHNHAFNCLKKNSLNLRASESEKTIFNNPYMFFVLRT